MCREEFLPLMAEAMHLTDTDEGKSVSLDDASRRLLELAEEERLNGQSSSNDARFAVYAWVDEKMLSSERPDAAAWMPLSLQLRFFGTTSGGELFYNRLEKELDALGVPSDDGGTPIGIPGRLRHAAATIPWEKRAILNTFCSCLLLGFRGSAGEDDLDGLRKAAAACTTPPGEVAMPESTSVFQGISSRAMLEKTALLLVPLAGTFLFFLYCAGLLADTPVKGF